MFSKLISIKFDKKYVSIVILLFTLIFSGCIDDPGSLEKVYDEELTPVKPGINSEFNTDSLHVEHKSEKKEDFMGQYTDRIHVFGKVENNANNSISLLRVAARFYDENQNLICIVYSDQSYKDLKPGESMNFDINCTKEDCKKGEWVNEIERITQYQIGLCSNF